MGISMRVSWQSLAGRGIMNEISPFIIVLVLLACTIVVSYGFVGCEEPPANISHDREEALSAGGSAHDWGPLAAYRPLVKEYAARYGVEPDLVRAIMMHESEGDARLVSRAGALGLMQCTPDKFGPGEDPFDPRTNIEKGTKYIARMLDKFGSVPLAVAAYNAGPGAVLKYGDIPPFPETQAYVPRVVQTYREYCRDT